MATAKKTGPDGVDRWTSSGKQVYIDKSSISPKQKAFIASLNNTKKSKG